MLNLRASALEIRHAREKQFVRAQKKNNRWDIDSGAFLHMGRKSLTLEEKTTVRKTNNSCVIMTSTGLVKAKGETTVYSY